MEQTQSQRELYVERVPAPAGGAAVTGEVPQTILDPILRDLEHLLGAQRTDFDISRSEAVRWNDGSLGCPEPGQMYTQSIVDGYRVVIEYRGKYYDYRATVGGFFKRCPEFQMPGRDISK